MKITMTALLFALVGSFSAVDAAGFSFTPQPKSPSVAFRRFDNVIHYPGSLTRQQRPDKVRCYMGDDDDIADEDFHDDEDGPLSKGVNSVSWLPSVHDSKPQVISGVKDVSLLYKAVISTSKEI